MKKIIALTLIVSGPTFANNQLISNIKKIPETTSISSLDKYKSVLKDDSQGNRIGKTFAINVSPIGGSFGSGTYSVELGQHLTSNDIITFRTTILRGYQGTADRYDEDREGTAFSLGLKKFTGNSFYLKPELYYKKQKDVTDIDYTSADGYKSTIAELENLGFSFRIGNQWQWESFTIGCDWIGLSQSFLTIERTGETENLEFSASLMNLYLGMSF